MKFLTACILACMVLIMNTKLRADEPGNARVPHGTWEMIGYNLLFDISDDNQSVWVIGSGYCYPMPFDGFNLDFPKSSTQDYFTSYEIGGITEYSFLKRDKVPERCVSDEYFNPDPQHVFDMFWLHFHDNYKFFELHGVDWLASYVRHRPKVSASTTEKDLWRIFAEMLSQLNDGHVSLSGTVNGEDRSFSAERDLGFVESVRQYMQAKPAQFNSSDWSTIDSLHDAFDAHVFDYVKNDVLKGKYESAFGNTLIWGALDQNTGYLLVNEMSVSDSNNTNIQLSLLNEVLESKILPKLNQYSGVVIDLRFNQGGFDAVALSLASMIASADCHAFTKHTPTIDGVGAGQPILLNMHEKLNLSQKPVTVLMSSESASAAEIFLLSVQNQPNIILIGEPSEGVLSDTWGGILPNGWEIRLSNETYISADGNLYEGVGVPPDIHVDIFVNNKLQEGLNRSLELARLSIKERVSMPRPSVNTCKFG